MPYIHTHTHTHTTLASFPGSQFSSLLSLLQHNKRRQQREIRCVQLKKTKTSHSHTTKAVTIPDDWRFLVIGEHHPHQWWQRDSGQSCRAVCEGVWGVMRWVLWNTCEHLVQCGGHLVNNFTVDPEVDKRIQMCLDNWLVQGLLTRPPVCMCRECCSSRPTLEWSFGLNVGTVTTCYHTLCGPMHIVKELTLSY